MSATHLLSVPTPHRRSERPFTFDERIRVIGQLLHAYLRAAAGYERLQVGPFLATFTPGNDHPNRNYAVPDNGINTSPGEIAALVAVYESRGLRPRLEYASSAAPALAEALLAAGFTIETTIPVLTCEPGQQRVVVADGIEVSDATDERDHEDAMRVAAIVYGEPVRPVPAAFLAARMAMVVSGGAVAVARDKATGDAIGSGSLSHSCRRCDRVGGRRNAAHSPAPRRRDRCHQPPCRLGSAARRAPRVAHRRGRRRTPRRRGGRLPGHWGSDGSHFRLDAAARSSPTRGAATPHTARWWIGSESCEADGFIPASSRGVLHRFL